MKTAATCSMKTILDLLTFLYTEAQFYRESIAYEFKKYLEYSQITNGRI